MSGSDPEGPAVARSTRLAPALACLAAAIGVGVIAISIAYALSVASLTTRTTNSLVGNSILSGTFMAIGLLLALRRPRLPIGWLLLLAGVTWSTGCLVVWPHHL